STLKSTTIGGAACPPAMIKILRDEFGVCVRHGWGMTEMSPVGTLNSPKGKHRGLSEDALFQLSLKQGRPLYGVEMKIVDAEGRELARDGKSAGNLLVRGPWILRRYFKDAGGDPLTPDGWLPTGDVGTIDADGYLQITDRSKDVIKSGGEWISSIELENIAGGGIGGLACALALAAKGFRALVLEQAQEFGEIGAGIQLAPNAWSALDALGVGEGVKQEAVFIERLLLMDGLSGETVIDIPLDTRFRERYGNPYAVTHRADIHRSLLDACKARTDLLELRTRSKVTGFDLGDEGVSVELGGGDRIAAAALVGADGWRSAVRERIVGDGEPPVSGHMCYRAVLAIDDMPKDLRWAAATLWAGPNTHIVHYPLRGWKLFNLVATVVREHAGAGHNEEAPPEEVLPLFASNCDKPLALLRVPRTFRRWMLRFREPVGRWSEGPVTLLGDAAHLMWQYPAQGAALAVAGWRVSRLLGPEAADACRPALPDSDARSAKSNATHAPGAHFAIRCRFGRPRRCSGATCAARWTATEPRRSTRSAPPECTDR